ncbi:MAG TPA: response regulator [Polyangiales bacterium]|nr:response regulator [Polyangiales bacterium]
MPASFRAKLLGIVLVAAAGFLVMIASSAAISSQIEQQLAQIRHRHVPRLTLGPRLNQSFERLRQALQDAVAAQDMEALEATEDLRDRLLQLLATPDPVDRERFATLSRAVADYYASSRDVSSRLIRGESGEALVERIGVMQAKQLRAAEALREATSLDQDELARAFGAVSRAGEIGGRIQLWLSLTCFALVLGLSLWLSSRLVRSMSGLASGFERFGKGDLREPIRVVSDDELGQLARRANDMAQSLTRLHEERDRADWVRTGHARLVQELQGDLDLDELGRRTANFLCNYLGCVAAVLYRVDPGGGLHALGQGTAEGAPTFARGEGLLGQAALQNELRVIEDVPTGYLRVRSGLGQASPAVLALLPLSHGGNVIGVVELGFFRPWSALHGELLLSLRETLAIAIEVADARSALRDLLLETQRQAQRLVLQEDDLRSINVELQAQQEELRQANDELRQQALELERRQRELEQAYGELDETRRGVELKAEELSRVSTYKSQFLANMSHELRTPLNSMLLLSNLLSENEAGNLNTKQVDYCKTIHGAGKDLLALINQVLDLAKIEAGKQDVRVGPVSLSEFVQYAQRLADPLARDKGLVFSAEIEAGLPETITTDRHKLEQILNNLLGNAIKFTERGAVRLRFAPVAAETLHEQLVAISVSDTGIGIAKEHQNDVFAPFEQVDGSPNRRYGGTGLGLAIARELAQLLGGDLSLQSDVGQGSTFSCVLPLAGPPGATAAGPIESSLRPRASRTENDNDNANLERGTTILIIEDDPTFCEAVCDTLQSQGLTSLVAPTGQTGLQLARAHKPGGIILDVRLPDIDGFSVMEVLRSDPETAKIPVHFVSALEAGERGMALGAVGYLTKPVSRRDLLRVLQALAPRKSAARVLIVEDDSLQADSLARRLEGEEFEVEHVTRASDALAALQKKRFHCLVLDLGLPDMDGLDLLHTLPDRCGNEMPSIVVHTARALTKAEAQRLEAYTDAVVLKDGQGADRLLDEVRLFARRIREGAPSKPRFHGEALLRLDGVKLLLVDDDMRTVYALSALLRAKGADVWVADTGRSALVELDAHPNVEIVLMDIMMPEMDGYEAMRHIRKDPRFRLLPIVALTAKAMQGDREKCLEAGATDYLPKPIDPERLVALLHERLRPVEALHAS